ncbi:MAG: RNA polymerase factor sigma-54 [Atribacterota bacterium]|nr:RNA polymerase factor sigma-54 [Atribacterota bacterium]MDD5636595.1 RNA polymerase factor sigma-54 [Atribacterota bacterium]
MEQNLFIEQKQTLQLSPQMYQSIRILQMNIIELNRWLEKESQENPVLEVDFNQVSYPEQDVATKIHNNDNNWPDDRALLDYFSSWKGSRNNNNMPTIVQEQEIKEQNAVLNKIPLAEHLLLHFRIMARDELEFKIGEYLIGNINYNGYLVISCKEAAQDLNIPDKRVRQVLAIIQNCSIPGLGARNLKECLLLQLKHLRLPEKELLKKLILFYLEDLSRKEFKDICRKMDLSYSEIQHLLDVLRKNFDPKPGRVFSRDNEIYFLIPDIIIRKINNQYEIFENKNIFTDIRINSIYEKMLLEYKQAEKIKRKEPFSQEKLSESQKTLEYLRKKISSARWILRCLEQKRNTIDNITRFIINYQQDFLEKGVTHLKPLSLEKTAAALGLNKSTVSRAIKSKKIQLPRGIYDMKYFFSKGLVQDNAEKISNEKIKNLIRRYVEEEDIFQPYSDQKLTEVLQERERIKVARRTVAKYRKLMDIPSAKIRRRYR